jgi:hypothetical protein
MQIAAKSASITDVIINQQLLNSLNMESKSAQVAKLAAPVKMNVFAKTASTAVKTAPAAVAAPSFSCCPSAKRMAGGSMPFGTVG